MKTLKDIQKIKSEISEKLDAIAMEKASGNLGVLCNLIAQHQETYLEKCEDAFLDEIRREKADEMAYAMFEAWNKFDDGFKNPFDYFEISESELWSFAMERFYSMSNSEMEAGLTEEQIQDYYRFLASQSSQLDFEEESWA